MLLTNRHLENSWFQSGCGLFTVSTEIEAKFVESWHKTAEQMKQQPGFIDTKLHRNLKDDGKYRYINVAHWQSAEAFKTAQANVEIFERQLDIEAIPDLYKVEAEYYQDRQVG